MSNLKAPPVYKVIIAQLAMTGSIAAISLLFSGTIMAYSVLLGGLISASSNSYFAVQAFRYGGARSAEKVVKSFIKGEYVTAINRMLLNPNQDITIKEMARIVSADIGRKRTLS